MHQQSARLGEVASSAGSNWTLPAESPQGSRIGNCTSWRMLSEPVPGACSAGVGHPGWLLG
eukprot:scaffold50162_cov18-Tisochrysis_lutea.AAC.2